MNHPFITLYEEADANGSTGGGAGGGAGVVTGAPDPSAQGGATGGAAVPSLDLRTYLNDRGEFAKPGWAKALGVPDTIEGKFKTFEGLAKSYANLEKMIGSQNKVSVPTEHSTPEEREAFFQKIGRPNKPDLYELKVDEKLAAAGIDDKELGEYKGIAHKLGLTQQQLAGLAQFHFGRVGTQMEALQGQAAAAKEAAIGELKKEWGANYDAQLKAANMGAAVVGLTPEVLKATPELANNPHFIKAMAVVAKMTAEQPGTGFRNQGGAIGINSPEAAKAEIARIRSDKAHPYNNLNANERDRAAAVASVQRLFEVAYPDPKP